MSSRSVNPRAGKPRRQLVRLPRRAGKSIHSLADSSSRLWSNNTKLVVSLALIALAAWLANRFREIVGVLLVSVLLAYLLYPIANWIRRHLRLPWRGAATIVFLLTLLIVVGMLTWGGFALVKQVQSLINFVQGTLMPNLETYLSNLPQIAIGNFTFPMTNDKDLGDAVQQLTSLINPVLSRTTSLLTGLVTGTATFLGWTFLTLLIAYFIVAESGGVPGQMIHFHLPGFSEDARIFGRYLAGIWNSFLRGQLTIILITIVVYAILLSVLGIRFAFGLALLAGLARFVPYAGPAVAWTTYGLVTFFTGSSWIPLPPLAMALLVVGLAWFIDIILDNLVAVRILGEALQIHPAMVTISVLIAANLLGFIGVILAAPVAATLKLLLEYIVNKLFDRDPWTGMRTELPLVNRTAGQFLAYQWNRTRNWVMIKVQGMGWVRRQRSP